MIMNAMLGALVGDAAGATLEFCQGPITEEMALNAMKMPGGGKLRVGPGQITDDGELTLTLWRALNNNKLEFLEALAHGYKDWYESQPFDIGRTCSLAFDTLSDSFENFGRFSPNALKNAKEIIANLNGGSEANGALMRATALATWIAKNPSLDINGLGIQCAKADAMLSHPSVVCQEVNAIYVFAVAHLLRDTNPATVLELTSQFVRENVTSAKVQHWFFVESQDLRLVEATQQIGHVRWAFVMAFYFLRHPEISFEEAIQQTLMKGGDTDTNAAIVGGLVGAYHSIPDYMLRPVLEFDCTLESPKWHMRSAEYSVKRVIGNLIQK